MREITARGRRERNAIHRQGGVGEGRFVEDLRFPGMLEAAFVRNSHAHAAIRNIDTGRTRCLTGVHAVLTPADLAPLLAQERLPLQFRTAQLPLDVTPLVLAKDEVAFVGEAVAVVVARNRDVAEDAAAVVTVDYEPLPAASDCRQARSNTPCKCFSSSRGSGITAFVVLRSRANMLPSWPRMVRS
jgi:CO/xanthine dehydrogenase Mo-binding subunit